MSTHEASIDRLFQAELVQAPHDYYKELRESDPVHEVIPGTFLITSAELILEAVTRTDVFSSNSTEFLHIGDRQAPGLLSTVPNDMAEVGTILVTADGEDHQRQRRIISRHLSTAKMEAMEPEFRRLVSDALESERPNPRVDWMSAVAEPLPIIMVARLLGLRDEDAADLKRAGYAQVELTGGFVPEELIPELQFHGMDGLTKVIDAYLEARGGSNAFDESLVGAVARAVGEGELTELQAVGMITLLVSAGGESTTSLTGTAALVLARQPPLQAALRADPSLVARFVEEMLRWDPPFRGHYRFVTRDAELGGRVLPASSRLVLVWPSANRDGGLYEEPDAIRLDRTNPRRHFGFGWGPHLCVGAPLARVEARVAIETLLALTSCFGIDEQAAAPRYHASLMVRRLESLPLAIEWVSSS